ncbi:helix-turn-helix domain-containing protein [Jeotgalibacillus marinus]|uniref:Helix-turn-helix domain-containing protein n=1 Tax=Jeotgalibacillus marinus TaxID=86667 RepID=A0ABV3Q2U1_9BACL
MSVIQKLLEHYPNARQEDQRLYTANNNPFKWYRDPQTNETIGFPTKDITTKELDLIDLILEPAIAPSVGKKAAWNHYLFGDSSECPLPDGTLLRIVLFSFASNQELVETDDPLRFVFSNDSTIVYQDTLNGYVIDRQCENSLSIEELSSAAQALETDVNIKVHFYVGSFHTIDHETKETLLQEISWYIECKNQIKRPTVVTAQEMLPIIALKHFSDVEKRSLFSTIFDTFKTDPDLANVIQTFVENLSNVSSTAKRLYLHRNSLQYRLDKFSDRTAIDLKSFHGSLIAYLACKEWKNQN